MPDHVWNHNIMQKGLSWAGPGVTAGVQLETAQIVNTTATYIRFRHTLDKMDGKTITRAGKL